MIPNEYIINSLGIAGALTIILLVIFLALKMERIRQLQSMADKLKRSLDEMDEQAKLIVRTDMELNKTQEELDKKMNGLYALQKLSRAMSTTLEENQLFQRIEPAHLEGLGFERASAFLWVDIREEFVPSLNIGYTQEEAEIMKSFIDANKNLFLNLIKEGETASSIPQATDTKLQDLNDAFCAKSFVVSPILPKEGNRGFLFVGTENADTIISEGDEELITILANQLGQALENARLFEQTWRAQQDLEKKVEERTHQLSFALEEVQKISRRKTDFVSSVSHELRTPLTSIKGYASILLAGKLGLIPQEVHRRLEKINQHADELVQFVNNLLDISRLESGRVTMKQEPCDLNKIIAEANDVLAVLMKEKEIEFSVNVAKDSAGVFADSDQIKRVFINLINNAIKYTPAKGKISVRTKGLDKSIQVDIADTGCGIPKEAQARLFQEFYRVDTEINQQVKGTGLGLVLVKNIIEAHNGKIWVQSKAGCGSTFSFTLLRPV